MSTTMSDVKTEPFGKALSREFKNRTALATVRGILWADNFGEMNR